MRTRAMRIARCPAHRGSNEPQGEPRAHDTDHVRDLHCSPILRRHPGCALALRLWPYHWCRRGLGDGVSHTVPIYEGYSMPHAIQRINLAGRDLTDYICKILQESKIVLTTTAERESAKKIKEDLCYVSENFTEEVDNFAGKEKQFEMPDGQVVTVHNQMIRCPELMFKPSLDGKEMMGLHELTRKTVNDCDLDVRKDLLGNVVMSGGTTMFPNMPERLQSELRGLVPEATKVKVIAPPERMISVWIGGSILSSLSTFARMWINRESNPDAQPPIVGYEEIGPRIVHQMCNS